jgi:uncharacterized protein DUF3592
MDFGIKITIVLILAIVGLPFFCVGIYEAFQNERQLANFVLTDGTVVDNHYSTVYDGTNETGAYQPVVEFFTADNNKIRFTDGAGSLPPDYETGEHVKVLYNPEKPKEARINSWKRMWLVPTLFCVISSLPVLTFGLWMVLFGRRQTNII